MSRLSIAVQCNVATAIKLFRLGASAGKCARRIARNTGRWKQVSLHRERALLKEEQMEEAVSISRGVLHPDRTGHRIVKDQWRIQTAVLIMAMHV